MQRVCQRGCSENFHGVLCGSAAQEDHDKCGGETNSVHSKSLISLLRCHRIHLPLSLSQRRRGALDIGCQSSMARLFLWLTLPYQNTLPTAHCDLSNTSCRPAGAITVTGGCEHIRSAVHSNSRHGLEPVAVRSRAKRRLVNRSKKACWRWIIRLWERRSSPQPQEQPHMHDRVAALQF